MQALGSIVLETFNFKEGWKIDNLFVVKKQVWHIKKNVGDSHLPKNHLSNMLMTIYILSLIKEHFEVYIYTDPT